MFRPRFFPQGLIALALVASLLPSATASAQTKPAQPTASQAPAPPKPAVNPIATMSVDRKPWTGDLDAMIKRRIIRVLVPH